MIVLMKSGAALAKSELKPAIYVGAAVSALVALMPYLNRVPVVSCILGPFAAIWYAIRARRQSLDYTAGANLGFLSAFYGLIAASALYDIGWHFFHEQLWRVRNMYRLLPLLAEKGQQTNSALDWYIFMFQLTVVAIIAGIIATPSGLLAVKLFTRRASES